ncbi:hypothetical protein [Companilactobacillus versmoldensis]|uniref:DUF2642 domain-containing protein n=1 Tax=Companilactobacillus versmoldensis DSM 14857 = KCTC 3814 TaxID=1423815 RepID=A0A0R1SIH4_9LACO|nr:hypothetical protein [Companilactobacillus versmoldensis]KRL68382.1 hypothetical protein FC27_GL000078 [Companilactobacillus versmoldensis DSM 14857 = KCTC 3814]
MQLQSRLTNNHFAQNLIQTTSDLIDRTFDFNFGENIPLDLIQMPTDQLNLFAKQSLEQHYTIILTTTLNQQYQGTLVKAIGQKKYIMKVSSSFYKIFELSEVKSINLAGSI